MDIMFLSFVHFRYDFVGSGLRDRLIHVSLHRA